MVVIVLIRDNDTRCGHTQRVIPQQQRRQQSHQQSTYCNNSNVTGSSTTAANTTATYNNSRRQPNVTVTYVSYIHIKPPQFCTNSQVLPENKANGVDNTEDDTTETFASTKEEEWVTKKKTEVTTTRQIETRVKREVVLEDGKVLEDSGPIVTTNTTEDTQKQEHEETQHRTLRASDDDDEQNENDVSNGSAGSPTQQITNGGSGSSDEWRLINSSSPPQLENASVVREIKDNRVLSREEVRETCEVEDVQHLGDITDEQYLAAVHSGKEDIREALEENQALAVINKPRIVNQTIKTYKTVDTEDTDKKIAALPDGRIISETKRTTEHEETKDEELSGENASDINVVNESSQRYFKTKDQEHTDYIANGIKIGREMRYTAETSEGERYGDPGMDEPDWDSLSTRLKKSRHHTSRNHLAKIRGLEGAAVDVLHDRKDALTKRPLDFDKEEETRKEETSKWLEHHFGSESRSSRDSLNEVERYTKEPVKHYFNVTIKSKPHPQNSSNHEKLAPSKICYDTLNRSHAKYPSSANGVNGLNKSYQNVMEWSEKNYFENQRQSPQPTSKHRNEFFYRRHHYGSVDELDRESLRYFNENQKHKKYPSEIDAGHIRKEIPERDTPRYNGINHVADDIVTPTPPQRKKAHERKQRNSEDSHHDSGYRSHSQNEMYISHSSKEELPFEEPPPDYSPPLRITPSTSPSPPYHDVKDKKIYQRTRFAADIPPANMSDTLPKNKTGSRRSKNIIGKGFRKLVGKIRSVSSERKTKSKSKRQMSRSPSPHQQNSPTYQQFIVIDNNLPPPVNSTTIESSPHHITNGGRHYEMNGSINNKQVSSTTFNQKATNNLPNGNLTHQQQQQHIAAVTVEQQNMSENRKNIQQGSASSVHRYYLGEDPFGGSIYGRENKYDGVRPVRFSKKYGGSPPNRNVNRYDSSQMNTSTLGRFSSSTSRLLSDNAVEDYSRSVRTLPRNLHHRQHHAEDATYTRSMLSHSPPTRLPKTENSNTINISIKNAVTSTPSSSVVSVNRPLVNSGPAKPARTYKSSLSRSKSFNVYEGQSGNTVRNSNNLLMSQRNNMSSAYTSNPHLYRIDSGVAQLKSPRIVSSISRSQRDINDAIVEETHTSKNGYEEGSSNTYDKRKLFMRGLADRAPELFRTLHGNEDDYRSGFVNTSTLKRNEYYRNSPPSKIQHSPNKENDQKDNNYTRTYHLTSKSTDPHNPSVTDTIKSVSKKVIPSKDGRSLQTIESTETKTITKSRLKPHLENISHRSKMNTSPNGGVIIEVRNTK